MPLIPSTTFLKIGASDAQIDVEQFVSAHREKVAELIKEDELGNSLARKRCFHVVVLWITEQLFRDAAGWEWIQYDIVKKRGGGTFGWPSNTSRHNLQNGIIWQGLA